MNQEPIFVAGPDRSGTTLMFALLATHPNISMVRRTNMWRYFHGRYGDLSIADNFERCMKDMLRYKRMQTHLKPDQNRIRREFWQGEPSYGRLFALFHQHNAERAGKSRWGDKSLHTEHYADQLFTEFPNAKIIHMVRDPRDRYASARKRYGKDTNRVGASTGRWLFSMRMAKKNLKNFPNNYLVLRYEMLAAHPEETMRQVCAFVHEEYSPVMLTMKGVPEYREKGGNSSFNKLEPGVISTHSIGRYRKILSNSEVAFIQMFAGEHMEGFGYQREPVRFSSRDRLEFYPLVLPINLVRMYGWMALTGFRIKRGVRIPSFRLADEPTKVIA